MYVAVTSLMGIAVNTGKYTCGCCRDEVVCESIGKQTLQH